MQHFRRLGLEIRGRFGAAFREPEDQIRVTSPSAGARDADALDGALALPQSRRVDERDRQTAEIEVDLDQIARRSRLIRDDRGFAPRSLLSKVDLPALGGPRIATRKPSRNRSEAGAAASA